MANDVPPAAVAAPPLPEVPVPHYDRLPLLGAWVKFNLKLLLDSTLDLVLVPASFVAVALGLLRGGDAPDRYFRGLMLFGRRAERYIDLFGNRRPGSVDDVLGGYERQVADEFERRGWSARAEAALRKADTRMPSAPDRQAPPAEPPPEPRRPEPRRPEPPP